MKYSDSSTGEASRPFMAESARQCLIYMFAFYAAQEQSA